MFLHEGPVRLDNGIVGSPCELEPSNPVDFHQAVCAPAQAERARIHAQVFRPAGAARAVVVVVPGSVGVAPSHVDKARRLTDAGIAALLVDPFGARGVSSTVANQAQYSFAASATDVAAAVAWLRAQDEFASLAIGTQGHSRGGAAVLSALTLAELQGAPLGVAGVYAAYPWCGQQFLNPRPGTARIRAIVGDRDDWCLPQQVQGALQAFRLAGGDASWRIVAGAHHGFDRAGPVEHVPEASVAPGAPTVYIRDDGVCLHPATGEAGESERALMRYGIDAGYGVRGAHLGSEGDLADVFHEDMMRFWQETFGA